MADAESETFDLASVPGEFQELLDTIVALNNGRPPDNKADFDRIFKKNPELAIQFMALLVEYQDELASLGFPGEDGSLEELEIDEARRPHQRRSGRRSRKR